MARFGMRTWRELLVRPDRPDMVGQNKVFVILSIVTFILTAFTTIKQKEHKDEKPVKA